MEDIFDVFFLKYFRPLYPMFEVLMNKLSSEQSIIIGNLQKTRKLSEKYWGKLQLKFNFFLCLAKTQNFYSAKKKLAEKIIFIVSKISKLAEKKFSQFGGKTTNELCEITWIFFSLIINFHFPFWEKLALFLCCLEITLKFVKVKSWNSENFDKIFMTEVGWIFSHGSKFLNFLFEESLRSVCALQICFQKVSYSKVEI